jgi:hypothetical protein
MIITLDYETFFDDEYSLRKMTTEAYIRDPRFKVHGCAVKIDAAPAVWLDADKFRGLTQVTSMWKDAAVLAHHAQFDGLILNHHYGIRPALWLDTLSMARIALPHDRHSLDNLSKLFGLPGKMHAMLTDVKGVRDPNAVMLAGLGHMSCDDANKTYAIFQQIKDQIPKEEFKVIDMTIRMFTEPVLRLDEPKLRVYHGEVVKAKGDTLAELGLTKKDLGSDEIVAGKYRELGVEPDRKTTAKGNEKYAFAKTDQFMRDMLEDEDERVATLTAARLGIKSTLNETRALRLLEMNTRGALCVYLRYAGAHTTRWSGGDSLNWQNYTRQEKDGRPGQIRSSIIAPPGKKIVVADSAQIECRTNLWLARQFDALDKFRRGEDLYSDQASRFYGRAITRADKVERHLGKTIILGCGYGMGAAKFRATCASGPLGGAPIYLTEDEAQVAVDGYRAAHKQVCNMWYKTAEQALDVLASRGTMEWGPLMVDDGAVWLPNGLPLSYDRPEVNGDGDLSFLIRGRRSKMYGGKLVENVVQALSRVILSEAMLRISSRYRPINTTHDEVMILADVDDVEALPYILSELRQTPAWAPGLPLDAEGAEGERYAK